MGVDAPIELDVSGVEEFAPEEMDPEGRGLRYGHHVAYALKFLDDAAAQIGCPSLRTFVLDDDEIIDDTTPLDERARPRESTVVPARGCSSCDSSPGSACFEPLGKRSSRI